MRIVAHVSKFYDWTPVPSDVTVTQADITAERVKPASGGGWLMKVTKSVPTHTVATIPEEQVIAKIIHDKCRPEGGRTLTRQQAVAFYMSENVMPHHAHKTFITKFEVDDDGPDEKMFRAQLAPHIISETDKVAACVDAGTHAYVVQAQAPVAAGSIIQSAASTSMCPSCGHTEGADTTDSPNIPPEDVEAHVAAYMMPATAADHVAHLHGHFKVKVPSTTPPATPTATVTPMKAVKR